MTENGEHGATAIWALAPGPSSCSDYNLVVTGTLPVELTEFSID